MSELADLKPRPTPTLDSQPFWDGIKEGRLLLQKCGNCGKVRHYPRPMCDACYSMEVDWVEAAGRGTVHSWTVAHHAFNPGFKGELPYVVALVDLDEGVRISAQMRDVKPDAMKIGMPVRIDLEDAGNGVILPVFRPA